MQQDDRFRFLVQPGPFPIDTGELATLAVSAGLGDADASIMDTIIASLLFGPGGTAARPVGPGGLPFEWGPQEHHFITRCTREQVVPYLIYRYKMAVYPKQRIVSDFPVYLLIEPASPCNLRCGFCFQVDPTFNKKSAGYMGYMDMDLYHDVINQAAAGGTRAITFASRGEPLLHPKLSEMLRYAADKKTFFDIKVNTNATLLSEEKAHAILSAGTSIVVVSADSADPAQYEELRAGAKFEEVVDNVRRFVDIREKHYPGSRTEIRVSGVKIRIDQDEKRFAKFWGSIVDTVAMVNAEERWDTYHNDVKELSHPCDYLWERVYCWYNGVINPCDADYKSLLSPGDIKQQSLREIWHGEAYTKLRQAHLDGKRNSYNPCDRCGI